MILRNEKIGGAVAVIVCSDNRAWIFEFNLVEANVGSDVFESVRPEIAIQADFALAISPLAYGDKINPSVVVVVECGHAPRPGPVGLGELDRFEASLIVSPQRNSGSFPMGKRQIHPAIVVEIED